MLRTLDLFSGIGGFAFAGQIVGNFHVTQFVEINLYCQQILRKHFPSVPIHDDITAGLAQPGDFDCITAGLAQPGDFDCITAGLPCQGISQANPHGTGLADKRSGLFFEVIRLIRECRPQYLVLENVKALLTARNGRDMGTVLWELSECGYDAEWQVVSAASMGAPHLRERVFIVAYPNKQRRSARHYRQGRYIHPYENGTNQTNHSEWQGLQPEFRSLGQAIAHTNGIRSQICDISIGESEDSGVWKKSKIGRSDRSSNARAAQPDILRVDDGIPAGMDRLVNPWESEWDDVDAVAVGVKDRVERIQALGNAVVPQCAAIALRRVLELERRIEI